jgi:hypothetical protein
MNWADQLQILRRFLRDPAGNVWGEALLRDYWNEVSQDLQSQTSILEEVAVIPLPPRFHYSYVHDWEMGFLEGNVTCNVLKQQGGYYAACYIWEVQEHFNIEADISDKGSGTFTHPWEAWELNPGVPVPLPFPSDLQAVRALYYDHKPLGFESRKSIERNDISWALREGEPISYSRSDEYSNNWFLYPRPSSVANNDVEGEGMVTSVSGDTTGSETGFLSQRTGTVLSAEHGLAVDVLEGTDQVIIYYDVQMLDVGSLGDSLQWPDYLLKYVRHGTIAKAFGANTDGRVPEMEAFWAQRYRIGIGLINNLVSKRKSDVDYRFRTQGLPSRRNRRHSRLPSGYPA